MRKELIDKFWQEMLIPTQEDDPSVAFANPADVARSLIKSRNWSATIVQEMIDVSAELKNCKRNLRKAHKGLSGLEANILIGIEHTPTTATKNNTTLRAFIRQNANEEQLKELQKAEEKIEALEQALLDFDTSYGSLERMERALERSTSWLVQYINWHKFELRELNQ